MRTFAKYLTEMSQELAAKHDEVKAQLDELKAMYAEEGKEAVVSAIKKLGGEFAKTKFKEYSDENNGFAEKVAVSYRASDNTELAIGRCYVYSKDAGHPVLVNIVLSTDIENERHNIKVKAHTFGDIEKETSLQANKKHEHEKHHAFPDEHLGSASVRMEIDEIADKIVETAHELVAKATPDKSAYPAKAFITYLEHVGHHDYDKAMEMLSSASVRDKNSSVRDQRLGLTTYIATEPFSAGDTAVKTLNRATGQDFENKEMRHYIKVHALARSADNPDGTMVVISPVWNYDAIKQAFNSKVNMRHAMRGHTEEINIASEINRKLIGMTDTRIAALNAKFNMLRADGSIMDNKDAADLVHGAVVRIKDAMRKTYDEAINDIANGRYFAHTSKKA